MAKFSIFSIRTPLYYKIIIESSPLEIYENVIYFIFISCLENHYRYIYKGLVRSNNKKSF